MLKFLFSLASKRKCSMKNILLQIFKFSAISAIFGILSFLVFYGQYISSNKPAIDNLNSTAEVSNFYSSSQKKSMTKSRDSSVRVLSFDFDNGMVSTSSATYMVYKNDHYILTTNHGLLGGCDTIQIEAEGELYNCLEIIKVDVLNDYALIKIEQVAHRKPIKLPKEIKTTYNDWKKTLTLLNKIVYTGYPNSIGPLTIDGTVMGFDPKGLVYVQSYAWSGSSGSGVFDHDGKLLGYILAIDVGGSEYGTTILENVMIVVPIYKVDWSVIIRRE